MAFTVRKSDSQELYTVHYGGGHHILRCFRGKSNLVVEGPEGPLFHVSKFSDGVYTCRASEELDLAGDPTVIIEYDKVKSGSCSYLSKTVYEKSGQEDRVEVCRSLAPKTADRMELSMSQTVLGLLSGTKLRPSMYHGVLVDRDNREMCVMLSHCSLYVVLLAGGLRPMVGLAAAISRIEMIEQHRTKRCIF